MKILLVYPGSLDEEGHPVKYKYFFLPSLAMAQLAGLSVGHEVHVINDAIEDIQPYIDQAEYWDFVGITAMTLQADRMYQIADAFRSRGTPVVLGGIHPTVLTDEAREHGTVVVGEAESIWSELLDDVENKRLKEIYSGEPWDMQELVIPRWDMFDLDLYFGPPDFRFALMPVFTTRGCPCGCRFCSVPSVFGKTYRYKPISNVLQELDAINAESYFFVDDNIFAQPDYARELFKALMDKDIIWFSQASTTMLEHPELIELAGKSGCFSLFVGIESIDEDALSSMHKGFNKVALYAELFDRLYRADIVPYVAIIFGFDTDTPHTFVRTLSFLKRNYVLNCVMSLLTPVPSTELYEELSGRMLKKRWSYYDGSHTLIRPKHFSPQNLTKVYWSTFQKFYQICREFTNDEIRDVYPMLTDGTYWIAMLYQQYGKSQVNAQLHPFAIGSEKI